MSDVMLHGILRMPPDCWTCDEIDVAQRHRAYVRASCEIERLNESVEFWKNRAGELIDETERLREIIEAKESSEGKSEPTFDSGGYLTDETLDSIRGWNPCDPVGLFEIVQQAWNSHGVIRWKGDTIELATGGWSGNEDIIGAVKQNFGAAMCWKSSHCGGLHIYEIPEAFRRQK